MVKYPNYRVNLAYGAAAGDAIKEDVIRRIIYRAADLLAVGTKIVPIKTTNRLEEQYEYPSELEGEYPVPIGAMALIENITWTKFQVKVEQGQVRYMITDKSKIRGKGNYQRIKSAQRAAEALADKKDDEILEDITSGAYTSNLVSVSAGSEWNSGNADADPEDNVVTARTNILTNSNIRLTELNKGNLVIPTNVWGALEKLRLIGGETRNLLDYFSSAFNMNVYPTRNSTRVSDAAYLVIYSDETAMHHVLQTNLIPMVEPERIRGVGDDYLIKQFFGTKVVPYASGQSTSKRIAKINNVVA